MKRLSLSLLFAGVILLVGITMFWKKSKTTSSEVAVANVADSSTVEPHADAPSAGEAVSSATPNSDHIHKEQAAQFDYKAEAAQISEIAKELPASKPKLLKVILSPDKYKVEKIHVPVHSGLEIHQRQLGAVKVLALRELMSYEKSKGQKIKDLEFVIKSAKDETIKNIATAALDSVKKDRPFFKDTLDAISNL